MSWSTRSIGWPASTISRRWWPSAPDLVRVETGRRLVEAHTRLRGERPGDGDELALALRELGRLVVGDRLQAEQLERLVDCSGRASVGRGLASLSVR